MKLSLLVAYFASAALVHGNTIPLEERACRPIKCAEDLANAIKNGVTALKDCAQAAASEGGSGTFGCATGAAKAAFQNLSNCQACKSFGPCDMSPGSGPHLKFCGQADGTIPRIGPLTCAEEKNTLHTNEPLDRFWNQYIMHCNNHHVIDLFDGCIFDCSACIQCQTNCNANHNDGNNAPTAPLDPFVFVDQTSNLSISKNIDGPMKRDVETRQARPDSGEPEDAVGGTARLRATGIE
jgi:hypothetical protein